MTDAAFWDRIAPKYAKSKIADPEGYEETLEIMAALLRPEMRVWEAGCGTGSTALRLAPGVAHYHGTDVAPGMIDIARGKAATQLPQAALDFSVLPAGTAPQGPIDAVLALNLLHLLPNLDDDLAAMARALPAGGLFISKTPLLGDGRWIFRAALPVLRAIGKAPFVSIFGKDALLGRIQNAGFAIEDVLDQEGILPRSFIIARKI